MKRKTYTAQCERAGDWWAISVPELRGVHTQARRPEKVEGVVRDAIAIFLDVPIDSSSKLLPVEQLALEGGEEGFGHGIVRGHVKVPIRGRSLSPPSTV